MRKIAVRGLALTLVIGLAACGVRRTSAAPDTPDTTLPIGGPSWIAGDRAEPSAGRVVIGLLVNRRAPRRLADMVPKAQLEAFLRGKEQSLPEVEDVVEWHGASYHTWGPQGLHLASIRDACREKQNVELEFREVLANECAGLPLVLAERFPLGNHERRALAAYKQAGGRLLLPAGLFFPNENVRNEDEVRAAVRGILKGSPLIHALDQDPFAVTARRDGDDVVITLPSAATAIRLENGLGETLQKAVVEGGTTARIRAPDPGLNPFAHHIVATWERRGLSLRRSWAVADLVGTLEREIYASHEVHAGGVLALRIRARLSHDSAPLADQTGRVALRIANEEIVSVDYRTGADGLAHPRLRLPLGVQPGRATLVVDDIEQGIQVTPGARASVVTDRPLYKQSDTVHVRAMVHRVGDGRPVGKARVELSVGDARRIVTSSEHGIASHTFKIAGAPVGWLPVRAKAAGAEAHNRVRVKAFERPTFTLAVEPSALRLHPGETAPVTVTATYVNGSPLVGGQLTVDAHTGLRVVEAPKQTDTDGRVRLEVQALRDHLHGHLAVSVKDADGRRGELVVPAAIEADTVELHVEALSDVAVGVPARFRIRASEPTTVSIGGALDGPKEVRIDETGSALVTLTPIRASHTLRVIARGTGTSVELPVNAATPGDDAYVLALDRRTARVGESVQATLLGPDGTVELDVWRDTTPVLTASAEVQDGRTTLELPLDASMAGVLRVFAHSPDGKRTATRATLLVTRGRALDVRAEARQPSYAPGETAAVDVTVRGASGEPTSAVLGYWGVDEALLALAPMTEGHERVFDTQEGTPDAAKLGMAEQVDRGGAIGRKDIAARFRDLDKGTKHARAFPIVIARTPQLRQMAQHGREMLVNRRMTLLHKAYTAAWAGIPLTELVSADTFRETLHWLAARDALDAELLVDPWGKPYMLWSDRSNLVLTWRSAGPDGRFYTGDDFEQGWSGSSLYAGLPQRLREFHDFVRAYHDPKRSEQPVEEPIIKDEELFDHVETDNDLPFAETAGAKAARKAEALRMRALLEERMADMGAAPPMPGAAFDGPSTNGTIGLAGGAGGSFRGRGGSRDLGGSAHPSQRPPYVRKDFDPTLCFIPEAIVGPDGKTTLTIPLKDSMTTWRLRLVASNAEGATGVGYGSIRVKQAVHATPWLSPHLTVGDIVDIPVAVRNEQGVAITARVRLDASSHLTPRTKPIDAIEIGPGGTGRTTFRYRAHAAGRATVRIVVDAGAGEDVQERVVVVHENARTVVAVANGNVIADAPMHAEMPGDGPGEVRLDLYPSPLAEMQSGFDGLIAAPHG